MRYFSFIFLIAITVNASFASAQSERKPLIKIKKHHHFQLPIDCTIGEDCWVMNYVDMGADDQKQTDPACLSRTYDGHKGTDIALLDSKTMEDGINVIVPLDGTILRTRDGENDQWSTDEQLETIKSQRKECGNAILMDHGDGLETIYCHMKKGSITVKPNQKVKAGDVMGQVGLSGLTQFPHLHFGILQDKKIIDPFTGQANDAPCGKMGTPLWEKNLEMAYKPFIIQNLGFGDDVPNLEKIERNGTPPVRLFQDSEILSFWVTLFGVREGDKISLKIKDPNSNIFARREIIQDKNRARQFYFIGRKTANNPLLEGAYTGHIKIIRDYKGKTLQDEKFSAVLIRRAEKTQ